MSNIQRNPNSDSGTIFDKLVRVQSEHFLPSDATPEVKYKKQAYQLGRIVSELPKELVLNDHALDKNIFRLVRDVELGVTQAIANRAPAIQSFVKQSGTYCARSILFTQIKYFLELVNIQRKPDLKQVMGMVDAVLTEFVDLSISDVTLCLRDIRTGKYGQLYESFSVEKLGDALRLHRDAKALSLQQTHEREKKQPENVLQAIIEYGPPEQVKKLFQDAQDSIAAFESRRVPPSVDNLQFFADKPKPKYKAAAPLKENDFAAKIRYDLEPRLDSFNASQFEELIDYYFSHRQNDLADWLQAEYEKRFPQE